MANDSVAAEPARSRRRSAVLGAAIGGCALVAASTAPAAAHPAHPRDLTYVSLGDSYTSGPAIPGQVDAGCARSDHNYPSLLAARRGVTAFKDVSCAGATTEEMWKAQGTNAPQLDALGRNTDLVTVQIGGNDVGFGPIISTCARLGVQDPAGNPCERSYRAAGYDRLALTVLQTAPKIDRVLRAVHARAPHARVLLVGYPDLLPDDGSGCFPSVPFAEGDFPYLRDTEKRLNLMLRLVASWNRAEYVDTYGPTVGHDMCKAPADRWIEPLQPASPAAPAHPNAKGEAAMAEAVLDRLGPARGRG
ncbi:SGNH/GDSL hydrolase family protein [Streptomyces collinus]|uniref:SGNH/GDSL hydrolase family protein n=1 Tax=Streptomyces collinus TaxID=42684 RepID=UPI001872C77F|nr:SGNH/GDSL hydrolase family protein [Streptomyces collinus]UJA06261.1 SGNH/GDSL hydrolase family protein [Streptomyces collinus]UJA12569.1 SGNH/GDSL hydrolase family protein [Streptomyces collinus]